jgi:RNA polymerase sigma-70 factor (ECF subfamily)
MAPVRRPAVDLLEGLRAGDPDAYETLVRQETGRLLVTVRRILRGDEEEARDVVQETMIAALQRIDSFKGDCRISTWLHRIAINGALMRLRSRRRRPETSIEEMLPSFLEDGHRAVGPGDGTIPDPETAAQQAETRRIVRESIDRLPDTYRVVVMLRDIEELSTEETARLLGITTMAVKLRLHRGRQALRELLIAMSGSNERGQGSRNGQGMTSVAVFSPAIQRSRSAAS